MKRDGRYMGILEQLRSKKDGRKTVIYCAGLHGVLFYNVLKICGITVDFFSDSDSSRWGMVIVDHVLCISPDCLKEYDCVGFICVGKMHYQDICEFVSRENLFELIEISAIVDTLILTERKLYFEVLRSHARQQSADLFYDLRPNQRWVNRDTGGWNVQSAELEAVKKDGYKNRKRIAVYTAVFGGYDSFCFRQYANPGMDYFYVSDTRPNGLPAHYHWIDAKKIIPENIVSPVKRNRFIKMHPHLFLKEYDFSVYIDGNVIIKEDISDFLRRSKTGIAVFMHPMRECIYYEALSIVNFKRVDVDDVYRQMNRYFEEGMPYRYGLAEMPVIVREHMKKACVDIMETWWQEFDQESQRDQLSFMYALWKNKFCMDDMACLGSDVRNCSQIEFRSHVNENRGVKNELVRS